MILPLFLVLCANAFAAEDPDLVCLPMRGTRPVSMQGVTCANYKTRDLCQIDTSCAFTIKAFKAKLGLFNDRVYRAVQAELTTGAKTVAQPIPELAISAKTEDALRATARQFFKEHPGSLKEHIDYSEIPFENARLALKDNATEFMPGKMSCEAVSGPRVANGKMVGGICPHVDTCEGDKTFNFQPATFAKTAQVAKSEQIPAGTAKSADKKVAE